MEELKTLTIKDLKGLKVIKDEEERQKRINEKVTKIYNSVIKSAESSVITKLRYYFATTKSSYVESDDIDEFYSNNKDDIINKLQNLLPDCKIKYETYIYANDKKMYNIKKYKIIPQKNKHHIGAILIDWS